MLSNRTKFACDAWAALVLSLPALLPALPAIASEATLYERIGGRPVLHAVVGQTLAQVTRDPAVNQSFAKVDIHRLIEKVTDELCAVTGGACPPSEDSVKTIHAGLNISEREFYALVEALRDALDEHSVGTREKNELLRILAPMKRDVVTR